MKTKKQAFFDNLFVNLPYLVSMSVWILMLFVIIHLVGLSNNYDETGQLIILVGCLFMVFNLPNMGRSAYYSVRGKYNE